MTTQLAQLLADRLAAAFPCLDRVVGLARLSTSTQLDGETPVPVKLPVPVFFTADDCELNSRYLVPDAGTPGVLFFEDGGSTLAPNGMGVRTATLNLLGWLNLPLLSPPPTEVQLLTLIERALGVGAPRYAAGDFLDISVRARTLPAEASLFSRYTFADTTLTPLLLPPYLVLGLALTVEFRVNNKCLLVESPTVLDCPAC